MPDVSSCGKHIGMIILEWFTVHICVFDQQLLVLKQNSPVCSWPPNRRQPGFDECRCRFVTTKMHLMAAQHTGDANRESSQAVMNSWLITNNQTNAKQLSDTPPHAYFVLLVPFICSPQELLWHEWMMNSFIALTPLPRTAHPRPCRWDRDRWRYSCTCVCRWGQEGDISFGVSGRQSPQPQLNIQPGELIWTREASWVADVTNPEWAGLVHNCNSQIVFMTVVDANDAPPPTEICENSFLH